MRVAREKLPALQRSRGELRAKDDHIAESSIEQHDSAKDERAHEDLAQLGVRLQHREKTVAIDLDDFTGLDCADRREAAPAAHEIQLTAELALSMCRRHVFARTRIPNRLERSREHDEQRVMLRAGF